MALLLGRRLLNNKTLLKTQRRHGYIVLVPEIGEDLPDKNPLVQEDGLPQFNKVTIENCMAAIGRQTLDFENDVKNIEKTLEDGPEKADFFKDIIDPLEKMGTSLDMTWGLSKTLYLGNSSLMPTKSYLAIHDRAKKARATKYNSPLIYRAAQSNVKKVEVGSEEERVVRKFALEGKLNGMNLDGAYRAQLDLNLNKMLIERQKFKVKIDAMTKKFNHRVSDYDFYKELPKSLTDAMPGGALTLNPHVVNGFMEYCPEREWRWNVWQALVSRGSGYGDKEFETSTHMEEIRYLRRDQAKILGFKNYAEISMETKMAGSVNNVMDTFEALLKQAKVAQDRELEEMHAFALNRGFEGSRIELWDFQYWRRKQCRSLFEYDEEKLKEYFPMPKVLDGLFDLCENLFNITIKQRQNVPTWHKDVKYYDVFETHSSAPVAGFYFDPYARSDEKMLGVQTNGWMVGIQNHSRIAETKPLTALVFNFEAPTTEVPSLLSMKDLQVLFHKFGQALQHLLSRTTYSEVSGLSNVEWDAVDVSGHFLSSWLYNKDTLSRISSHYMSEDKLPGHTQDSLIKVRQLGAGTELCKELYLSALDLEIHSSKDFWLDIVKRLWPQYRSFPLLKHDSHATSFTQIFYEEWAAAYYSHTWSKMIAADVYSAFHEVEGQEQAIADVGKRFRDTFLASGGGCHPNQVFRNFRGRDPSPKALLAALGLKDKTNSIKEIE
ncbi:PREDICTED: probable cytosolic oligopeptidase A [Nicrophorus vespilloides]|uniref:Probable cytosolic oligopeptidase A n=1 Tax=Nicrophorus vespilloides TaxID=110193 RepID=A0ABM1MTV5_NICVS|nr:PREDICTED: probable cytosolic oligopeptidase A [Nicrophorus vespilloides]